MVDLIAVTPCAGLLPLSIGGVEMSEVALGPVTSLAPFRGREQAVSQALQAAFGLGFAGPNESLSQGDVRVVWAGIGRALLIGAPVPETLAGLAAVVDQSDSMAVVRVAGAQVEAVLARLVPVDLRLRAFAEGATARTMLGHMTVTLTRIAPEVIEVMAMRSMAATLVHELAEAARGVAARG